MEEIRKGDFIQTRHRVAFYPLDPRPIEISIADIAHALSLQCRFTGHVRKFYSVAEHSVHVSRICDPAEALWGLLHDASEAYLCDVSRPIKRLPEMAAYRAAEKNLQAAIMNRFGLAPDEPPSVKHADTIMLGVEARDLMSPLKHPERWAWCTDLASGTKIRVTRPWTPDQAREKFLARFAELTKPVKRQRISDPSVTRAASIMGKAAARRRCERSINSEKSFPLFLQNKSEGEQ